MLRSRGKMASSTVWKYFSKLNPNVAQCNYCKKRLKTGGGTTNLRQHLNCKHPNFKEEMVLVYEPNPAEESDKDDEVKIMIERVDDTQSPIKTGQPSVPPEEQTSKDSTKRRKVRVDADKDDMMRTVKMFGKQMKEQHTRDEFSVYGEHIANELREFKDDKYRQILAETKQKINAALFEAAIGRINLDGQVSNLSSTQVVYLDPNA